MKRSLNDILLEARKISIKDKTEVMECLNHLADCNFCSLMEDVMDTLQEFGGFQSSLTNILLTCYKEFGVLNTNQKLYALKHLTFKEFICLMDYASCDIDKYKSWIDDNRKELFSMIFFAFTLLRIRGNKNVCNFMRINLKTLDDIYVSSIGASPFKDTTPLESMILLDYINSDIYSWDCHLFKICDNYDIDRIRTHFLDLALSCPYEKIF